MDTIQHVLPGVDEEILYELNFTEQLIVEGARFR